MRFMQRVQAFMRGRYGYFDELNKSLVILGMICLLVSAIPWLNALRWIGDILVLYACYRFFSKRIYPRSNENKQFLARTKGLRTYYRLKKEAWLQRKRFVYFRCPSCKQSLRAPRGKGTIKVTCATCHQTFTKKV